MKVITENKREIAETKMKNVILAVCKMTHFSSSKLAEAVRFN